MCEKGFSLQVRGLSEQSAAPTHYLGVCPQWAAALRRSRQTLSYCCCCCCCCYCLEKKQRKYHSNQRPQWKTGGGKDGDLSQLVGLKKCIIFSSCRSHRSGSCGSTNAHCWFGTTSKRGTFGGFYKLWVSYKIPDGTGRTTTT